MHRGNVHTLLDTIPGWYIKCALPQSKGWVGKDVPQIRPQQLTQPRSSREVESEILAYQVKSQSPGLVSRQQKKLSQQSASLSLVTLATIYSSTVISTSPWAFVQLATTLWRSSTANLCSLGLNSTSYIRDTIHPPGRIVGYALSILAGLRKNVPIYSTSGN